MDLASLVEASAKATLADQQEGEAALENHDSQVSGSMCADPPGLDRLQHRAVQEEAA